MSRKTQLLLLALLCLWAAAMAWVPRVDFRWTAQLTAYRHHPLALFARRTLFQGQLPGATDPAALLALATLALYLRAHAAGASSRLLAVRPVLGFLLVSAVAATAVVHTAKLVLGRTRPLDVLSRQHLPYTQWYQIGKLYLTSGPFRGSFPSGHTAAVFAVLALAYALAFDPAAGRGGRAAGGAVAVLALAGAGLMTVANAMGGNHWLSDGLGAVGLVWLIVHQLYFRWLDVPAQRRRLLDPAGLPGPPLPRFWEARLCGSGLLVVAGAALALLGLRAFAEQHPPVLAMLLAPGAGLLWLGLPRARALLRDTRGALGGYRTGTDHNPTSRAAPSRDPTSRAAPSRDPTSGDPPSRNPTSRAVPSRDPPSRGPD
ncbi:MAG TPA: phosphatase PAP2 family protein [Thermoanaerobaculia bacterium]|nr:phosphatase PAP2 family protein [Thermoanaerobaculia bacterium]